MNKFIKREIKYHTVGKFKRHVFHTIILMIIAVSISLLSGCNYYDIDDVWGENLSSTEETSYIDTTEDLSDVYDYDIVETEHTETDTPTVSDSEIPKYNGNLSIQINNNVPNLNIEDASNGTFIRLSELDSLGRCGVAYMCAGEETLPTGERGEIGHVKPSGWHTVKYPDIIPDRYLYNRSHLLMWALSGLNSDERNLITGTRMLNADSDNGMLHYETLVLDYIKETGNHVLYKVEPYFRDDELVARGVHMQALSVEDKGISFNVFIYNVQNGIEIDYKTGESWVSE